MIGRRRGVGGFVWRAVQTGLGLLALQLAAGCQQDLPLATNIERMRILGAEIRVLGDTGQPPRVSPRPGEEIVVDFVTAFPTLEGSHVDSQSLIVNCTAPTRFTGGIPFCQEFIDAASNSGIDVDSALDMFGAEGRVLCDDLRSPELSMGAFGFQCVDGAPRADFRVPENFDAEQALIIGVVCEHGGALVDPGDPNLFGCASEGEAIRVHALIPVSRDQDEDNHTPILDDAEFFINAGDGTPRPWPAYDPSDLPAEDNCESRSRNDETIPRVDHLDWVIRFELDPELREEVDGELETLEVSVYTTVPEIERRFTLFEPDTEITDNRLSAELEWDAPKDEATPGGRLVRFYFTVLDQRGGLDVEPRALCFVQ